MERKPGILGRVSIAQSGRQLALEKIEETVLIRSDLQQDEVVVASLEEAIDGLEMTVRRRPAAYDLGYRLGRHMLARGRETFGVGQFRQHRPAGDRPAKIMMRRFACVLLSLGIAHRHLGIARRRAAADDKRLDQIGPRLRHDQAVPLSTGEARRFGATGGNRHGRLAIGPVEQAGMIQPEVFSPVVLEIAHQQAWMMSAASDRRS